MCGVPLAMWFTEALAQLVAGGGTLDAFTGSLLEGDVNWPAVFAALQTAGYGGYLTAEVLISEKGIPDTGVAAKVCREMKDLIAPVRMNRAGGCGMAL